MLITFSLRTPCIYRRSLHAVARWSKRPPHASLPGAGLKSEEHGDVHRSGFSFAEWICQYLRSRARAAPMVGLPVCLQLDGDSIARCRRNYPRSVARESGRSRTCTLLDHHPKFVPASHQNQILDKHVGEINNLFMVFIVLRICSGITYTRSMRKRNKG
jgi:hypothetical protein